MSWDQHVMQIVNVGLAAEWLDVPMWAVTVFCLPMLFATPLLLARKQRRTAVFLAASMIAAGALAVAIQFVTMRPRPEAVRLVMDVPPFPSFPSGHAAIAFAWATFLALVSPRRAPIALGVAAAIAFSRLYVGHHYPSDVILGAVLGAATSAVAYGAVYRRGSLERPRWSWWLWAQLALVLFAGTGAYLGLTRFDFLTVPYADKILHFVLFGALAFLLVGWFAERSALVVTAALTLVAVADELLQALSPVRAFDPVDLVCTLAGIFMCAYLATHARSAQRPSNDGHPLDSVPAPS